MGNSDTVARGLLRWRTMTVSGRVIHCGSVSKSIAPGLRVGWVIPSGRIERVCELKRVLYPANPTVSELVVAEFLDNGGYERHLQRCRTQYAERCSTVREAVLKAFPDGTKVNSPQGGFVLWIEMAEDFDSEKFAVEAFAKGISQYLDRCFLRPAS